MIILGLIFIILGTALVYKISERARYRHEWLEEYRNYRRYYDRYCRQRVQGSDDIRTSQRGA